MLTMVLGGLWHGASWAFIAWGALHGIALVIHREWTQRASLGALKVIKWIAVPLTFYWVLITWVPFRANDVYVEAKSNKPLRSLADGFYDQSGEKLLHKRADLVRDPLSGNWIGKTPAASGEPVVVQRLTGSFGTTAKVWQSLVLFKDHGKRSVVGNGIVIVLAILILVHWLNYRRLLSTWWRRIPDYVYAALLGAGVAIALFMKPVVYKAFIYFQF
jgi:hypothetical protein